MVSRLVAFFASLALTPIVTSIPADEEVTLLIPGLQCPTCVERLTESLARLDPSVMPGKASVETKQMPVSYDSEKVTLHQLVQMVSETPPVHGKPYAAGLLITVEDAGKNAAKVRRALSQVKGVLNFMPAPGATADSGDIVVTFRPLPRTAKPADHVRASQLAESLEKGGLKFSGLPLAEAGGFGDDADSKKKQSTARGARGKSGGDELPERTKPVRTPPARTRPAEPADPAAKKQPDDDRPRFEILAEAGGRVYLVDHETKSDQGKELKKFVKLGDEFGEFVVKQVGDDDGGLFVVLEQPETKVEIRVERISKEERAAKEAREEKKEAEPGKPDSGPRFQILAIAGDRVYLADNETKLKKFVQTGDKFGDFNVKEVAEKEGWFVVLEKPGTKDVIRFEEKKQKDDKASKDDDEDKKDDKAGKDEDEKKDDK